MSATQQSAVPDVDAARQFVFQETVGRAFLGKLASVYGIVPRTEQELDALWEMADMVQANAEHQQVKQAAAGSPILSAHAALRGAVEAAGVKVAGADDRVEYETAAALFADETVYNAVLTSKLADAVDAAAAAGYAPSV